MDLNTDPAALDGVAAERPIVAIAIAAVVATVVYLALQLTTDGQIDLVETMAFTTVFTGVYVSFLYFRRQLSDDE